MTTSPCTPCATANRSSALPVNLQNGLDHGAKSGTFVLCTCVLTGIKPQRSTSAKLIWLRAPMTSAPMIAKRIKAYIPSAERRVKSHMNISKLRPRFARGSVLGLVVAMLTSRRADDHEDCNGKQGQEDRPLYPNRLALMDKQLREQVNDADPQAIDGMEEHTEENKDLEQPIFVECVKKNAYPTAQE